MFEEGNTDESDDDNNEGIHPGLSGTHKDTYYNYPKRKFYYLYIRVKHFSLSNLPEILINEGMSEK